jgi:ParB family transcriptional regulator, chromosome partitioning protein
MTLKTVALSALCPAKDNPRRHIDRETIVGLAESIKTDGVIENLVVEKIGKDKFRVRAGSRRYLALKLLERRHVIDGAYRVPVDIRRFQDGDALRISTMENVHRVDLEPIDEAEAFAKMLQNGASIDDVAAKTGLSGQTIRRRLALADLCQEVKDAVQKAEVPLGIAEAMTLGTHDQQRSLLHDFRDGAELDRDGIRDMLCAQKPTVAIAMFALEQYTGTFTRDLFADEEATYFDDVEQFFALQKQAVEDLAEKHRKKAAWVDVFNSYSVPWWQYGEAKKGRKGGVVINLHPTGRVEIKKGLVRHQVKEEVVEATQETPEAPKERPETSAGLVRYAALHKSIAVQAALLQDSRKAKEIAAVALLLGLVPSKRLRIDVHPCLTAWDESDSKPAALACVSAELARLSSKLGVQYDARARVLSTNGADDTPPALLQTVQVLSDDDLDRLSTLLVLVSFGQGSIDELDTDDSLFNRVAAGLGVTMRNWWTPDVEFLALLRKDQLETVAIESGASLHMAKFKSYGKKEMVEALARYFERTADPAAELDEHDHKGQCWQPGIMCFPARPAPTAKEPN